MHGTMRVALLTNFIAPYRLPLLEALRDQVGDLRVLVSTPMERDRFWGRCQVGEGRPGTA